MGIAYRLVEYAYDPSDLSATAVAAKIGLPACQVFKTLCVQASDGDVALAVLPGDRSLELKALARAAGKKSVAPVPLSRLTALTGYVRGGVTALACRKPYPVYLDESARDCAEISVSAGKRGLQMLVAPEQYARATGATYAELSRAG